MIPLSWSVTEPSSSWRAVCCPPKSVFPNLSPTILRLRAVRVPPSFHTIRPDG